MDLDDGSSNSSGDEEAVVAAAFAAASAILNVVAEEEDGRRCTKVQKLKHGGSRPGKAPNLNMDFAGAYKTVVHQYFSGADSLYNEELFEQRFGCPRVVVDRLIRGDFNNRVAPYNINGRRLNWMYFLADGIYPRWSIFVKTCKKPHSQAEINFLKWQEHARKDIESCFGVLVKKFRILKRK